MSIQVRPGESLTALADRVFNGDVYRFTEILDLNPNLSPFEDLPQELSIEIPEAAQILNFAKPALTLVSQSVGGAGRFLSEAEKMLNQVSNSLPESLQGYAQEAIASVGEINGVLEEAEQAEQTAVAKRFPSQGYQNQLVTLVPWLLGRR